MKTGKTHCKHGHIFDEQNTYLRPNGSRSCKACNINRQAIHNQRKSEFKRQKKEESLQRWLPVISEQEAAWVAGLFEGEGTVTIATGGRERRYTRLVIILASTDIEIVDFLQQRWKGNIRSYKPKTANANVAYNWSIANRRAQGFIKQIYPHIRTKRVKAKFDLALEMQSTKRQGTRLNSPEYREQQELFRLRMKELNRRGLK